MVASDLAQAAHPLTSVASGHGVCLATTAAQPGGVWRHICDLAEGLIQAGIDVRLELPPEAAQLHQAAASRGLRVGGPRFVHEVYHAHLANTYDMAAAAAMARARLAGSRVVITEHLPRTDASDPGLASRPPRWGAPAAKTVFKAAQFRLAHRVIAVSSGSASFLTQRYPLPAGRLVTVFNGVRQAGQPVSVRPASEGFRLVATGSVVHQKGFDILVAAGAQAKRDWRVDVYGSGPHLERLRIDASSLRLRDGRPRIVFHGWTDDVRRRVSEADALLMPSRWEALPYSALEAMSWAVPVVGTTVDGLTDVVVPGVTGLLVEPTASALAQVLDDLAVDARRLAPMGRAAAARVSAEFTFDAMMRGTIDTYENGRRPVPVGLHA